MANLRPVHQPGLEWQEDAFGIEATWLKEPSIDIITKIASQHLERECAVQFLAEGAFNKVFTITCERGEFVFQVALPVAPKAKTLSEVATIAMIRAKTSIPVPRVLAYSADLDNELGFEWIFMERVNGRPLEECWHELSWLQKGLLVQKMAQYLTELSRLHFTGIGSVYQQQQDLNDTDPSPPTPQDAFVVSEAIQGEFFRGDHIQLALHRGPYPTSNAYISAQLAFLLHDISFLRLSPDPRDHQHADEMLTIHTKLQALLPSLFPPTAANQTHIYHDDLSLSNILINAKGEVAGIIDWEALLAAPAWEAFQPPSFLCGPAEHRVPSRLSPSELSDPDVVQEHDRLVRDYEATQLQTFFLQEMRRLHPAWVDAFERGSTRRDVLVAIANAGNDMCQNRIRGWLDCLLEGRQPRVSLSRALDGEG